MLRKMLAVALLAMGAMAVAPLVASAASGYQVDNVTDSTPFPGQSITVVFNGFKPGSNVTVTLFSDPVVLGTFVSKPGEFGQGVVEATVTIPSTTSPGAHRIVASGIDAKGQPLTVSIQINVSGTGSGLPATGTSVLLVLAIGGLTVLLGWALLGTSRRHNAIA